MPKGDLRLLEPHLEPLSVEIRHPFEKIGKPISHVYFMEEGIASVVAAGAGGDEIEVGLIGREGMTGIAVVMGGHRAPHKVYIQVRGRAQRMEVSALRGALETSATLQLFLLKFALAFMVQTAHTAFANGRATLEQRLARWILMARDRLDDDEIPLTHEFLSLMLAVRRPGGNGGGEQSRRPRFAPRGARPDRCARSRGSGEGRRRLLRCAGSRAAPADELKSTIGSRR
jgi:CRP-like cAMP-binding protein